MSNLVAWMCVTTLIKVLKVSSGLSFEHVLGNNLMTFWVSLGIVCFILDLFRAYKYFSETK